MHAGAYCTHLGYGENKSIRDEKRVKSKQYSKNHLHSDLINVRQSVKIAK